MNPSQYPIVAELKNDTSREMRIFLELTCEEVFLPPGQKIQLLAKPTDGLAPIVINYIDDGLQIFAQDEFDPDWHIRFMGKIIKPGYPTRLSEWSSSPQYHQFMQKVLHGLDLPPTPPTPLSE